MTALNQLGERLRSFYGRYATYIDMTGKLVLALVVFFWIRATLGMNAICSNPFVLLILAVLCMLFPVNVTTVIGGILVIGNAFSIGLDAGAVTIAVFLILLIMFLRFVPENSASCALIPVLSFFGLAPLIPILDGVRKKPSAIFGIISGVTGYYTMAALSRESKVLAKMSSSDYANRLDVLINGIFSRTMVLALVASVVTYLVVYAVRKLSVRYAFYAAIPIGAVVYFLMIAIGNMALKANASVVVTLIGAIISAAASLVLQGILRPLDYTRTERLEFEDDDYYYYVKAIPRAAASKKEKAKFEADKNVEEPDVVEKPDLDSVDFEKGLEDSLKNL